MASAKGKTSTTEVGLTAKLKASMKTEGKTSTTEVGLESNPTKRGGTSTTEVGGA